MPAGKITFIGHASFKVETTSGKIALIDPWLRQNPVCPPELKDQPAADLILVTHGHGDHLDADLPAIAEKTGAAVIVQAQIRPYLTAQGVKNLHAMNIGGSYEVNDFRVTMTQAFHNAHINMPDGTTAYQHEAIGYVLGTADGLRIYFAGDTGVFGDMKIIGELYRPHIAALPIGDRVVMGPTEAAYAARLLGVKHVIPFHYGVTGVMDFTGTVEAFREAARDMPDLTIHAPQPGETVDAATL